MLVYLLAAGNSFLDVLSFCVVLLIASIPIAMRVVCVTTLAIGCERGPSPQASRALCSPLSFHPFLPTAPRPS